MIFVVAKTIDKNSSGSKIIANPPLKEVAAATSSYVFGFVIPVIDSEALAASAAQTRRAQDFDGELSRTAGIQSNWILNPVQDDTLKTNRSKA